MPSPLVVVWRVTERCNLACGFCAYDRTLSRSRRECSLEEVEHGLRKLATLRRSGREVLVSWLGGEPTLWPHLEAATLAAVELGLAVSMTSNGLAFGAPRLRALVVNQLAELTLSIDGPEAVHDRFRGQPGQRARLLAHLAALRAERDRAGSKLQLKVNTILLRESVDAFAAFVDELVNAGADAVTFNDLGPLDRPAFHALHHPLPEQIERFAAALPEVQRRAGVRGLTVLGGAPYLERLRATHRGERVPVEDCRPGEDFWFVDARGGVSPCSFTTDRYALPLADVEPDAVAPVLRQRREAARHPACDDCRSTQQFAKFNRQAV